MRYVIPLVSALAFMWLPHALAGAQPAAPTDAGPEAQTAPAAGADGASAPGSPSTEGEIPALPPMPAGVPPEFARDLDPAFAIPRGYDPGDIIPRPWRDFNRRVVRAAVGRLYHDSALFPTLLPRFEVATIAPRDSFTATLEADFAPAKAASFGAYALDLRTVPAEGIELGVRVALSGWMGVLASRTTSPIPTGVLTFGDVTLSLRYQLLTTDTHSLDLAGQVLVKIPTGDPDRFTSSDTVDVGFLFSSVYPLGGSDLSIVSNVGIIDIGERVGRGVIGTALWILGIGASYRLSPRSALSATITTLGMPKRKPAFAISLGGRFVLEHAWLLPARVYPEVGVTFGLSQNVLDLGLRLGLTFLF